MLKSRIDENIIVFPKNVLLLTLVVEDTILLITVFLKRYIAKTQNACLVNANSVMLLTRKLEFIQVHVSILPIAAGYHGEGDNGTLCDQMVSQTISVYNTVINQVS